MLTTQPRCGTTLLLPFPCRILTSWRRPSARHTQGGDARPRRRRGNSWLFWGLVIGGSVIALFIIIYAVVSTPPKKGGPRFDF